MKDLKEQEVKHSEELSTENFEQLGFDELNEIAGGKKEDIEAQTGNSNGFVCWC